MLPMAQLGCGTGAVGIFAAALGARKVTLTDGGPPALLSLASANAKANEALWAERGAAVQVVPHTWGEVAPSELHGCHFIFGSDLTYSAEAHQPLCRSLAAHLVSHSPHARVILAHEERVATAAAADAKLERFVATANATGLRVLSLGSSQHAGRQVSLLEVQDARGAATAAADGTCAARPPARTPELADDDLMARLAATPGVYAPKLRLAYIDGLRGVRATEAIEAGELLLSVPLSDAFTEGELDLPTSIDPSVRLAAAILVERLSDAPRRAAHLAILPTEFPSLAGRLPAHAKQAMSPALRAMADAHVERDLSARAELLRACAADGSERTAQLRRCLDEDAPAHAAGTGWLRWALDVVTSRSYGVVCETASGGAAGSGARPGSISERVASGDASIVYAVAPLLDLFNHATGSKTRVELQCDPGRAEEPTAIRVFAGEAASAGEQLFLSYGAKCNNRFLASYGFVPATPRNPEAFVTLRGVLSAHAFEAFTEGADPRLIDEMCQWQRLDFRIYDSGRFGTVDPTLLAIGKALLGSDAALARALGARARDELAKVDGDGSLQEARARATKNGDSALEAVLRCQCADRTLWERFATAMERYAAMDMPADGGLATYIRAEA